MVFMGTAKYPDENEWSAFLSEHGGEDNGETNLETTTCYFDVHPDHLRESLDRFAAFFAAPLFNFDSAAREVKAIESEFQQAKQEDENRLYQLLCHLTPPVDGGVDGAAPHPYARFTWGDKRSLEQLPAARGVDMRSALQRFHKQYYSAHLMTVVVLGKESLDTLQGWVHSAFADVPERPLARPSFATLPPPFAALTPRAVSDAASAEGTASGVARGLSPPLWIRVLPLKERRRLELHWFVPSLLSQHRAKPEAICVHIIGHEAPGSVLWALKDEGLATSLCAGIDEEEHSSNAARFGIQIELTPAGLADVDRVIELVLAGVGFVARSPIERWLFDELRHLSQIRFDFAETEPEIDYVRRLAISLQRRFDPNESLRAECVLEDFDPAAVRDLLARLNPRSVIATLEHRPADGAEWQTEPWFGTEFDAAPLDGRRLESWIRAYDGVGTPPRGGAFALPPRNPFISTDFTLRGTPDKSRTTRPPPALLRADARGELFHAPDVRFGTPKAVVCLQLEVAPSDADVSCTDLAAERMLRHVAARYALESINAECYAATLCGYTYELHRGERGWSIEVHGFAHKLGSLLNRIAAALAALRTAPPDGPTLRRVVGEVELQLQNACFAVSDLATDERLRCIEYNWLTASELLAALPAITPDALTATVASAFEGGMHLVAYVGGNVDAAGAQELYDAAYGALGSPSALATRPPLKRCVLLPAGRAERSAVAKNPADENSAVDLYWQIGPDDVELSARLNLLEHLMYEPLFNSLRTKQQLGYTVGCSARNTQGALGFLISVVSQTHTPYDIERRARAFVVEFVDSLREMRASEYATNVRAAAANRLLADKTIEDEASRYWAELDVRAYAFQRAEREADAMRGTSQSTLVEWVEEMLLSKDARQLSIVVRPTSGVGATPAGEEQETAAEVRRVGDPNRFAAGLPPHPRVEQPLPQVARADA